MSNASTLRRDDSSRVDAALRNWRSETVSRRETWDAEQEVVQAQMRARRKRTYAVATLAGSVFAMATATGMALTLAFAPSTPAAAASIPTPIPMIGEVTDYLTPVVQVEHIAAATPAVAGPLELREDFGVLGEVRSWRRNAGLWIQFDYTGAPIVLKWTDAAGTEVMERTPCVYNVGGGVRRCYVGRTARRVALAQNAGAEAGTWTASACRGDACRAVATYAID